MESFENTKSSITGSALGKALSMTSSTSWNDVITKIKGVVNQGAKTSSLNCGGSYTIPAGYHNGSGKIIANSLSSQTSATAAASDILSGKTAWVSGSKRTGTMANRSSTIQTATTDASNQSKSCYRLNGSNIEIVPAIGYWGTWDWGSSCIRVPINNVARMTSGDWTVTAGWCGFRPDIVFFRGNVSGTQFPIGIYCNVNGMYINVVEGQSQSHYGDVITVNDTGWSFNRSMAYIDGRAIKYVCLKITP